MVFTDRLTAVFRRKPNPVFVTLVAYAGRGREGFMFYEAEFTTDGEKTIKPVRDDELSPIDS